MKKYMYNTHHGFQCGSFGATWQAILGTQVVFRAMRSLSNSTVELEYLLRNELFYESFILAHAACYSLHWQGCKRWIVAFAEECVCRTCLHTRGLSPLHLFLIPVAECAASLCALMKYIIHSKPCTCRGLLALPNTLVRCLEECLLVFPSPSWEWKP